MVTFDQGNQTIFDSNIINSVKSYDSEIGSEVLSNEFEERYGRPGLAKTLSYKVVGRLSRWEGGNSTPYQGAKEQACANHTGPTCKEFSCLELMKQFFSPTYDLTEVTIEDIQRVKMMHDRFLGDAQFNFNYVTLLIIASVIAGVGLGSNSVASIIASMLVSPLMGPVTAMAYGISIGDCKMVRIAFVTEVISLCVCIVTGLVIAGLMFYLPVADNWPTPEMTGRGNWTNFFCGIPIAFFSGLGVAVGLLDSQTNSLVGVAISASLLPPAVNAGMLWVIQWSHIHPDEKYSHDGTISLFLTLMNIVLIIVASIFMFRLKEILPIEKSIFWEDLGVARKIYHNVAVIPKVQEAPTDSEIQKRVTKFFPRASTVLVGPPTASPSTDHLDHLDHDHLDHLHPISSSTTSSPGPLTHSMKNHHDMLSPIAEMK